MAHIRNLSIISIWLMGILPKTKHRIRQLKRVHNIRNDWSYTNITSNLSISWKAKLQHPRRYFCNAHRNSRDYRDFILRSGFSKRQSISYSNDDSIIPIDSYLLSNSVLERADYSKARDRNSVCTDSFGAVLDINEKEQK